MKRSYPLLTLGIASCVLAGGTPLAWAAEAPVQAVPLSAVLQQTPLSTLSVTSKNINKENELVKVNVSIPVISGMKDTRYQAELNDNIERLATEDLANLEKQAQEGADQAKQQGFPYHPYELSVTYKLTSNGGEANAARISLRVDTYTYTGGANGMPRVDTYNFTDGTEAKPLTLQDLFGADYKQTIDAAIRQTMQANPSFYFPEMFKGISDTQPFYLEQGQAVIVFQKYDIAPGAAGTPEFRIPLPGSAANAAGSGVIVTAKTVNKTTELLKATLSIPVLSGMNDTKYQAQVNESIERKAMEGLTLMEQQAQKDYDQSKQSGYTFRPYELDVRYVLKSAGGAENANRISLEVQTYTYTGGANGMPVVDTYNFTDGTEAKPLTLQDLFGENYKQTIDAAIQQQIAAHPDDYFKDAFQGISDSPTFYVENGDAVIVFSKYEVAPGAAGTPEFRIPLPGSTAAVTPPEASAPVPASGFNVNGQSLTTEAAPVYLNEAGVQLVPLRVIADTLGYTLTWDAEKRQAELSKGAQWTVVQEGKDAYIVNKMAPVSLGTEPVIHDDKLYVPLTFFSNILKQEVKDENGIISILSPK